MKKTLFLINWLVFEASTFGDLYAQSLRTFSIVVKDRVSGILLEGVSIELESDSPKIQFEISNANGQYTLYLELNFRYTLAVYHATSQVKKLDSFQVGQKKDPSEILLEPSADILESVTVKSDKQFIAQSVEKITVEVVASLVTSSVSAYEGLLKTSGVLEQDDRIHFRGNGIQALINDRPSNLGGSALKEYLGNQPAASIEKIELIPNRSTRYDADGGSVINLKLGRDKNFCTNGTLNSAIGTGRYYQTSKGVQPHYQMNNLSINGNFNFNSNSEYFDIDSYGSITPDLKTSEQEYEVKVRNSHSLRVGIDYDLKTCSSLGFLVNACSNGRNNQNYMN